MAKGTIQKSYEAICYECETHILGLGCKYSVNPTKKQAEKELREDYRWITLDGQWVCQDCQINQPWRK